jgi:hypothetical protein
MLSKDEAKFVFERGCEQFLVGSGQMGNVRLSPEAEAYFAKKDCKVLLRPTPEAIQMFGDTTPHSLSLVSANLVDVVVIHSQVFHLRSYCMLQRAPSTTS